MPPPTPDWGCLHSMQADSQLLVGNRRLGVQPGRYAPLEMVGTERKGVFEISE